MREYFTIDQDGNIKPGNEYHITDNEGGGDCFFYSIIDSGVLNHVRDIDVDQSRNRLVRKLRRTTIDRIRKDIRLGIIVSIHKHLELWYTRMANSTYWADDYMISAIQKELGFKIIMLCDNGKIYCHSPYQKRIRVPKDYMRTQGIKTDGDYVYTYNSVEKFMADTSPFIIIWYRRNVHFEIIDHRGQMVFAGFDELKTRVPRLVSKYIRECRLIDKMESFELVKEDLRKNHKAIMVHRQ